MKNLNKKIILVGGGTGGSVAPLLAIAAALRERGAFDFLFIGTKYGPEREMAKNNNLPFKSIISGKWRRYFSLYNFTDLFKIKFAFWQSLFLLIKEKPDLIISAGSFVAVPIIYAAYFLKIPVIIHQQDIRAGFANKLSAPLAKIITVTFEKSLKDYKNKAVWLGNPSLAEKMANFRQEKAEGELPLILIIGGGTGSAFINDLTLKSLDQLKSTARIIHITGKQKSGEQKANENYQTHEFLPQSEILQIMTKAEIVVSRCGLGVLTEISALKKPAILIPMPNSHQEDNAQIFSEAQAAKVLEEKNLNPEIFIEEIKKILSSQELKNKYSQNISKLMKSGATEAMVGIVEDSI